MVTKGIITSVNRAGNRCTVRLPLFETAASSAKVEIEALVNITPGLFCNLVVGDVVFVTFEENELEKPIIIGKLFINSQKEYNIRGGTGVLDELKVRTAATIPCSTLYEFSADVAKEYKDLKTPKKVADYIKWLEKLMKKLVGQLDENFTCLKNWAQYQLQAEHVEVDDGDLDAGYVVSEPCLYQEEGKTCKICGANCTKNKTRSYLKVNKDKNYPNI